MAYSPSPWSVNLCLTRCQKDTPRVDSVYVRKTELLPIEQTICTIKEGITSKALFSQKSYHYIGSFFRILVSVKGPAPSNL